LLVRQQCLSAAESEGNDPGESLLVGLCVSVCAASMGGHTHFHPAAPARSMAVAPSACLLCRCRFSRSPARAPPNLVPESVAAACCSSLARCRRVCCCWSASRENLRPRIRNSPQRLCANTATAEPPTHPPPARPPCAQQLASKPICAVLFIRARAHTHTQHALVSAAT
jgi:hypothetical protein